MLRRKLIARLGVLVIGFVAGAVIAIVLLQGVLRDLDKSSADNAAVIDSVHHISLRLRGLIIGLTIAALVMANIAVIVLLQTGRMILKPVGELVEGSRMLARERFDHRVHVAESGEFGELAHAYNRLAEQLQANEQRKIEMLQQLAVTLNHELNNVISIIEYQLGLIDRHAAGDTALGAHLLRIREGLGRMAGTVASLKNVRRIVLTDYLPGQKMLDLPLSTLPDVSTPPVSTPGTEGHAA